jgi:hypothetical protein
VRDVGGWVFLFERVSRECLSMAGRLSPLSIWQQCSHCLLLEGGGACSYTVVQCHHKKSHKKKQERQEKQEKQEKTIKKNKQITRKNTIKTNIKTKRRTKSASAAIVPS